jgi:hypothetical protein
MVAQRAPPTPARKRKRPDRPSRDRPYEDSHIRRKLAWKKLKRLLDPDFGRPSVPPWWRWWQSRGPPPRSQPQGKKGPGRRHHQLIHPYQAGLHRGRSSASCASRSSTAPRDRRKPKPRASASAQRSATQSRYHSRGIPALKVQAKTRYDHDGAHAEPNDGISHRPRNAPTTSAIQDGRGNCFRNPDEPFTDR